MIRVVSWNMAHRVASWSALRDTCADIALLQEAGRPDPSWSHAIPDGPDASWETALIAGKGPWRTAVLNLSEAIELRARPTKTLETSSSADDWVVSRFGSIGAADIAIDGKYLLTVVSVYAAWEKVGSRGYADGSAHRILSDLSALTLDRRLKLVVAGDWNLLRGYGEHGDDYWRARYETVFSRAETLGLKFVGPEYPYGRQADPWPPELPADSLCVPTFHHSRQRPETATRQLDFVFASPPLVQQVRARALNEPHEWGPSDHCRVVIDIEV